MRIRDFLLYFFYLFKARTALTGERRTNEMGRKKKKTRLKFISVKDKLTGDVE